MCMCGQVSMWLYFTYFIINYYTFEDLVYKISLMFDIQVQQTYFFVSQLMKGTVCEKVVEIPT